MPRSFLAIKDTYRRFKAQKSNDENSGWQSFKSEPQSQDDDETQLSAKNDHHIWNSLEFRKQQEQPNKENNPSENTTHGTTCRHFSECEQKRWFPTTMHPSAMATRGRDISSYATQNGCQGNLRMTGRRQRSTRTSTTAALHGKNLIKEFGHLGSKQFWMQFMDRSKWPSQQDCSATTQTGWMMRPDNQTRIEALSITNRESKAQCCEAKNHYEVNGIWHQQNNCTYLDENIYQLRYCKERRNNIDDCCLEGWHQQVTLTRNGNESENIFKETRRKNNVWKNNCFGKLENEPRFQNNLSGSYRTDQVKIPVVERKSRRRRQLDGQREDSTDRPYVCHICNKSFKRRSSLATHKFIHTDLKPHNCTECNKKFLRKSDLKKHCLMHSGKKPYKCEKCGRQFSQSSNMLTHMRRHMGIRPFNCVRCGRSFFRKVDLRRHEGRHLAKKTKQRN